MLGTSAQWYWYSGSCGDTHEGIHSTITVSPTVTTTYYVRAEGTCNITQCLDITVTVNYNTVDMTGVTASQDTIIKGNGVTLSPVGGELGTGADWIWYTDSCGGTYAGNGGSLLLYPQVTTTYYVRGEGVCNTTGCLPITITVFDTSVAANMIVSVDTICSGTSITLGCKRRILGTKAHWYWYTNGCGATLAGLGDTITVVPTVTTDYFVRAEGLINTTMCIDKIIVVNTLTYAPAGLTADHDTIHIGDADTLRISGGSLGTGADWYWYNGSCGGTLLGNGQVLGVAPTVTTNYYLRGIGVCNTTSCDSIQVYVIPGYVVSGTVMYDQSNYALDSVWLFLRNGGNIIDSTRADINGMYQFNVVPSGTYTMTATTHKPWGGVNSTDAVKVKRHFAGSEYFTTALRLHAADVNLSMNINTTDAVKITRRFVGSDTAFTRGDWNFEKPTGGDTLDVSTYFNDTIVVNGANLYQDFKGICIGDVNGSNIPSPGAKSTSKVQLNYSEVKKLNSGQYIELPIKVTNYLRVGAISLIMNYPEEMMEILDAKLSVNNDVQDLYYNAKDGELRIGWFETDGALSLQNNETFIILKVKTGNNFKAGDNIRIRMANNSLCELADEYGEPIENVTLSTWSIEHVNTLNIGSITDDMSNDMVIYPNPAKDMVKIQYNISGDGFVKISMYNLLGEKISDIVNEARLKGSYDTEVDLSALPSGVYTCKMLLDDNTTIVKRVVISR